jgi:hypothetical protein
MIVQDILFRMCCRGICRVDLFLYLYEADFEQGLLKKNEKKLARSFNFTFRYIDDVISLNNSRFGDFVDGIYPIAYDKWNISVVICDTDIP